MSSPHNHSRSRRCQCGQGIDEYAASVGFVAALMALTMMMAPQQLRSALDSALTSLSVQLDGLLTQSQSGN